MREAVVSKSTRSSKKYQVVIDGKKVHFGASGYEDYTKHKDSERKERYISRHKHRECWTKRCANTPGFWARWLLWNKPTLRGSASDIKKRFGIKVKLQV